MGLTDEPRQLNIQDVFPPGTPFTVHNAWVEGQVPTKYGNRTMGKVLASPIDNPSQQTEFSVWGSLVQQVQQGNPDDYPMTVQLVQKGDPARWLFAAADAGAAAIGGDGEGEPQPAAEPAAPPPAQ